MKSYSWEFGSAKKHIDKSCFASNETGIPKVVRQFFCVEELGYKESVHITLVFDGSRYSAKIENPTTPEGRRKTRMVWGQDFTDLLRAKLPGWDQHFERDIKYAADDRPCIIFEQLGPREFSVSFSGQ
ncbi:MAG: hypothetical protein H8E68_00345 [Kiritimatiellaeota bacterium]|nr:hypothetical protein [Kiritimatiellota bacterium]